LEYLRSVKAPAYAEASARRVAPPWLNGKWIRGDAYLAEVAVPNFYFHVTTAYAILRHNGVGLGKMDYVGSLPGNDAWASPGGALSIFRPPVRRRGTGRSTTWNLPPCQRLPRMRASGPVA